MENNVISDQKNLWNKLHEKNKGELEKVENTPTVFARKASFYIPNDGVVLEIGPGGGRDATYFIKEKNCNVIAVDFSQTALDLLEGAAKKAGISEKLTTILADTRELQPFKENTLDLFYAKASLHLSDSELYDLFKKIIPALKKEAHVFIEGRTNIDSKIAHSITIDTNLVNDIDGHLRRCWDADFIKDFCKKIDLELLEISEITEFRGAKEAHYITFVARKK